MSVNPLLAEVAEYKDVLVKLDGVVDRLYNRGFIGDADHDRWCKFIHSERFRVDRAIQAGIATPPVPNLGGNTK